MDLKLIGHQIEITQALHAFVAEKFQRLTDHSPHIASIHVVLKVEKIDKIAEATVNLAPKSFHAIAISTDMYTSIDELVHKLDKQLLTFKGKRLDNRHEKED